MTDFTQAHIIALQLEASASAMLWASNALKSGDLKLSEIVTDAMPQEIYDLMSEHGDILADLAEWLTEWATDLTDSADKAADEQQPELSDGPEDDDERKRQD